MNNSDNQKKIADNKSSLLLNMVHVMLPAKQKVKNKKITQYKHANVMTDFFFPHSIHVFFKRKKT